MGVTTAPAGFDLNGATVGEVPVVVPAGVLEGTRG